MRFIHAADIHLGRRFRRLPPHAGEVCREDLKQAFRRLTSLASARGVDALLLGGDLFDEPIPGDETVRFARNQLEMTLAGRMEIHGVTGNHDPCVLGSPYASGGFGPMHVFTTPAWERRLILGGRCALWGMGYDFGNPDRRALAELQQHLVPDDVPQVVLVHADYDGGTGVEPFMPFSQEEAESLPVAYIGLGHVHDRWHPIPSLPVHYPGPVAFVSVKSRQEEFGCLVVELGPSGEATVEFAPLCTSRVRRLEIDVTGLVSVDAIAEAVAGAVGREQIAHVRLGGAFSPRVGRGLASLQESLAAVCLAAVIEDETRADMAIPAAPATVREAFVRRISTQLDALPADADRRTRRRLELALAHGIAALDGEVE